MHNLLFLLIEEMLQGIINLQKLDIMARQKVQTMSDFF